MKLITERKIDELGRIVLPSEIRSKLGITSKSTIGIFEDNGNIVLKKTEPSCKLCGSTNQVNENFSLCAECIAKVKQS
ncbi:MAG: AbrB/MazE/SpoVT family DNA-binding domain-containing protein [Oscillospiraceae bacterium]|nr:AbrB/MazE/SpoVT family DNA-binding domain-containing protein [Oscillospiraceae bacterium]